MIFYSICEQYLLFYKVFTRSICAKSNSIILECTLNMAKRRKNRQTRSKETGQVPEENHYSQKKDIVPEEQGVVSGDRTRS